MKLIARGGTWQVHFTDHNGERQRLSTKVRVDPRLPDRGKAMANLAAIDRMRDQLLGDAPAEVRREAGKGRTLAHALQRTYDERWSKQKARVEMKYLVARLKRDVGYWPLSGVTYSRLNDYGQELAAAGDAPATRNRKMSAIRTALTAARLRGEIDTVPTIPSWREENLKERYLTVDEEKRLAGSMAENTTAADEEGQYMRRMVPFLLDTGLRAGEAILDGSQDLGETIWLPHGTTKSGRGRTVPLTPRARECLDYILASPVHETLRRMKEDSPTKPTGWMGRRFRTACKTAKIHNVSLHTLRHTCASRLVQAGVSLYVVKEWLGHSSITVTERYAHLAPKSFEAAVEALSGGAAVEPEVAHRGAGSQPFSEGNLIR